MKERNRVSKLICFIAEPGSGEYMRLRSRLRHLTEYEEKRIEEELDKALKLLLRALYD